MNIFVLDRSPAKSAQMLCDAHVVKMIVESAQLLSTHDRITGRFKEPNCLYKPTHQSHPCRMCLCNYANREWLICHLKALLDEYSFRYCKIHKSSVLFDIYYNHERIDYMTEAFSNGTLDYKCRFPKCMPNEFKVGGDDLDSVVLSYRKYYKHKQQTMKRFRYTNRDIPNWLKESNYEQH